MYNHPNNIWFDDWLISLLNDFLGWSIDFLIDAWINLLIYCFFFINPEQEAQK